MILLYILLALCVIISTIAAVKEYEYWGLGLASVTFAFTGIFTGAISMLILVAASGIGQSMNTTQSSTTRSENLVSIQDGKGIDGKFYGGLFLTRGYIQDTQQFSYYQKNGNGSYKLDKRPADRSTIWMDATPETARVDITDSIYTCTEGWWYFCPAQRGEFAHADFHIPPGSIKEEYTLDTQ